MFCSIKNKYFAPFDFAVFPTINSQLKGLAIRFPTGVTGRDPRYSTTV